MKAAFLKATQFASRPENASTGNIALAAGLALGLLAAYVATSVWPVGVESLESARAQGIISPGTLSGYVKYKENIHYLLWMFLTVGVALIFWLAWALLASRRADNINVAPYRALEPAPPSVSSPPLTLLEAALAAAGVLLLAYSPVIFWGTGADWVFLQDQGMHLSWANTVLHGGVLYRDTHLLYGPLMEYPLAAAMSLVGASVLTLRVFNFILNLIALVSIALMLRRVLRWRLLAYTGAVLAIVIHFPLFPGMQSAVFRTTPAVVAVFLCWLARERRARLLMTASGLLAGFALFYSQETGVAALAAIAVMLVANAWERRDPRASLTSAAWAALGVAVVAIPVLAFLALNGALAAYVHNVVSFAGYRVSSYPGIPYPDLRAGLLEAADLLSRSVSSGVFPPHGVGRLALALADYLPVALYMTVCASLAVRLVKRRFDTRDALKLGLVVLGVALFPYTLSLSAAWSIVGTLPPVTILAWIYMDDLWPRRGAPGVMAARGLAVAALAGGLVLYGAYSTASGPFAQQTILKLRAALGAPVPYQAWYGEEAVQLTIPRAEGMWVTQKTRGEIESVVRFIRERTAPSEHIFVFSYSPVYYFLTDRTSSTRFDFFLMPNTREDRRRVIADLERDKTRFVIYDGASLWGVPIDVMEPEIVRYLKDTYVETLSAGAVKVLERREK
ncbi:MAG: hypothetical protein Q7T26_04130 [Dehalococcoidia bacterium]|nr:hypothetical protein [Dehalococcoidia bacterium]